MHPRYGNIINKSAAPLELTAFCESVRRKNHNWTKAIIDKLSLLNNTASIPVIDILRENRHFAGTLFHYYFVYFLNISFCV
jgi:hypothetical protein